MDVEATAKKIIAENKFLTLATSDGADGVFATPLTYCYDHDLNFYFVTAVDSVHCENIRKNPCVAFAIFDTNQKISEVDGIQATGIIGQVPDADLPRVCKLYFSQAFPDPTERAEFESPWENYTKDDFPIYRFFQIAITNLYKRDTENTKIDRRVIVDMQKLKAML